MNDTTPTFTIKQALTMEGMQIPRITGNVKQLWDRKTGSNDNGEWSMQSGVLSDGQSDIKFTLSGFGNFPYHKNQTVVFRCKSGKKGLTGVKIKKEEYQGKENMVLWITPSAIICLDSEESDEIPGLEPSKTEQTAPQSNVDRKQAITEGPKDPVQEVKKRLMQYANLRELTDHAAAYLNPNADPSLVKDISSCFFIQAMREGLADKLPNNKPISKIQEKTEKEDIEDLNLKPDEEF